MSRYNHFSVLKYIEVNFSDLNVGDKFRRDVWKNNRRKKDVLMEKTITGFVIEKDGKFWTDQGERGCGYFDKIEEAYFLKTLRYCKDPTSVTYGASPHVKPLSEGRFVAISITYAVEL